jgi:hypothetical protein
MGALKALALAAALLAAGPAWSELLRVEAVGSVPLGAASAGGATARQDALEAGLREAVERTALELVAQSGSSATPEAVRAALGGDAKAYAARYRILEDRGEREPLLEASPGAQREYVVSVEAEVDQGRIRSRLAQAGLLAAPRPASAQSLRIVLEGVDSYPLWARIRKALAARGSARPLEFAPGRIVAEVQTDEPSAAVVDRLGRALGEDFSVHSPGVEGDALRVAVAPRVAPEETPEGPPPAPASEPAPEAPTTPGAR